MKNKLRNVLDPTMLRFIIVGIINTIFGTAVMFFCYEVLHYSYWISSGANYFFGSILSFFLNKHYTFRAQETGFFVVLKFTLNILCCWVLAYGFARPLTSTLLKNTTFTIEMQEKVSMLVGMVLFTALNYLGQRFFTFSSKK